MKISTTMQNENSGSKEFWKSVKHITGKSKTRKQIGPISDDQEEPVFNDLQKTNVFATFFSTIGEKLATSFQLSEVGMNPAFHRGQRPRVGIQYKRKLFKAFFSQLLKLRL